jgi:hypothetical protein
MTTVKQRWAAQPLAQITDLRGEALQIYGVSMADISEHADVIFEIHRQLRLFAESSPDATLEELYISDRTFRVEVDRALELNGIPKNRVRLRDLSDLLVTRVVDGQFQTALLIEINTCKPSAKASSGEAQTFAEVVAALTEFSGSVKEAHELTHGLTVDQLTDLIAAHNAASATAKSTKDAPGVSKSNMERALVQANDTLFGGAEGATLVELTDDL